MYSTSDTVSVVKIQVKRSWSPLGADRFYALVLENYFQCSAFYRYVEDFIVQFGFAADPEETANWDSVIPDDPLTLVQSNTKGTITFATSGTTNSRSTHLFFNLADNSFLDLQGFSPFGVVLEGYDTLTDIYNPTPDSSGGIDQAQYSAGGNDWVLANYPDVTLIQSIVISDEVPGAVYKDDSTDKTAAQALTGTIVVVSVLAALMCVLLVKGKKRAAAYLSLNESDSTNDSSHSSNSKESDHAEVTIEL